MAADPSSRGDAHGAAQGVRRLGRGLRAWQVVIGLAVLVIGAGCGDGKSFDGTAEGTAAETTLGVDRDSTLRLTTRTAADGTKCYTLVNPVQVEPARENCPDFGAELFENDFVFGGVGASGELNYVIYWVSDAVRIVEVTLPYFRSDDAWTVFESGPEGPASFVAEREGAEYNCVAYTQMSCELR